MKAFDIRCTQEGSNSKQGGTNVAIKRSRRGNNIHIPPGTLTGRILAARVGVHEDTIVRWRKAGLLPYTTQQAGELKVYIYDEEAIVKARKLAGKTGKLSDRKLAA